MSSRLFADALVVVHLAFIVFAVGGGVLVLWQRGWALLHVPAVAWATWIECTAGICPLTPWEQALRHAAGEAGYAQSFVDHYLVPVIYPAALTPALQMVLGLFVLTLNVAIYAVAFRNGPRASGDFPA